MIELLRERVSGSGDGLPRLTTFLNPYSYRVARRRQEIFRRFDTIHYDGIALVLLMKLAGVRASRKSFDMTSMALEVLSTAAQQGRRVYFVGSEPGVPEQAATRLKDRFAGLQVAGIRHGFFANEAERVEFIQELTCLAPDIVIVGMGAPRQEKLLLDLADAGWRGEGYTCGGFLHQTAKGGTQYYPPWMDRMNLRWMYRIFDEPKLIKRYTVDYSVFVWLFAYDLLSFHARRRRKG
ncbi:WecB/TagA/CpsF family glycosyltransferase [Billgrantia sp. C5P2]|uniref:WecB/TagA/CpsF family glycosyltransferase n=1 Tax=Billgrantia sp. C5P2 TaxID=3436239 RepID=UPI003DA48B46